MKPMRALTLLASALAAVALVALVVLLVVGAATGEWPDRSYLVSSVLVVHVLALGSVIARFSAVNLRGQARLGRYAALLALALAALVTMAAGQTLAVFATGWTLSTVAVLGLVGHPGTPGSARAVRRIAAALVPGDVGLWLLVALDAGLDLPDSLRAPLAGLALIVALVSRGALVPLGEWLAETAEAPSPVSALLHAGVVNGGVLLLALHGDVLAPALATRVLIGVIVLLTLVAAVVGQQARSDVKGRLAASTSSQMALATAQAVVGLPATAFVHVLLHAWWKSRLFLNAGGAVTASRLAPAPAPLAGSVRAVPALAGVAVALMIAVPLSASLPVLVAVVPAALVGGVAGTTVSAALAARRAGGPASHLGVAAGTIAAIVALVVTVEESHALGEVIEPSAAVAVPVLLGLAAAWVCTLRAVRDATPLVLLRARLGLPAWAVRRHRTDLAHRLAPFAAGAQDPSDAERIRMTVGLAADALAPAWPLRAAVAVSPWDGLERLDLPAAQELLDDVHGRDPRVGLRRMLALHDDGRLAEAHLAQALADLRADGRLPAALAELTPQQVVTRTRGEVAPGPDAPIGAVAHTLAGRADKAAGRRSRSVGSATERVGVQAALWCGRAWDRLGAGRVADPYAIWLASARRPGADLVLGVHGLRRAALALPDDAASAVEVLYTEARRRTIEAGGEPIDLVSYLTGLLAAAPGWTAHALWRAAHGADDAIVQLCALRAAHDLLLTDPADAATSPTPDAEALEAVRAARGLLTVWQRALDVEVQGRLLAAVPLAPSSAGTATVTVDSLWCLDARSGPVRRQLEAVSGPRRHRTHGVAGFFGIALEADDPDGTTVTRAPGLLDPDLRFEAPVPAPGTGWSMAAGGRQAAGALGYAEFGGLVALVATVRGVVTRALQRPAADLHGTTLRPAGEVCDLQSGVVPAEEKARRVAAVLHGAGLAGDLGSVLLVIGHGATTANNAYAAAYDCGACGANTGVLNASVFAAWTNDPAVRAALPAQGIAVPDDLVAIVGRHDTTADVVAIESDHPVADALRADLATATERARAERSGDLPGGLSAIARGGDEAEPMPEWGLAGAHGLFLGGARLSVPTARWFQLDYHHDTDPDLAVLTGALAGPGLVAAHIMSAYGSSAGEPDLYGAGDKTTHNVVGDIGVVRGRAGDLSIGLPWQAVTPVDPRRPDAVLALRHLPARPVLAVQAPRERLRAAVAAVPTLEALVLHGWVTLWAVEPQPNGEETFVELGSDERWTDARRGRGARPSVGAEGRI
ncbi:Na-translocating system protein MpsB [Nocardioides sp. TRM66260-LWL]|uniref:putative inorganic carbon transporter subunit DabA n=1 Tax=Nocardioides sp. TRM66260-LWL TaxID=2874478 RepID=UPI001CC48DF6|nr:putative inorganic carbon transporter subunit DabA [Nocardioides sp. TRM66260-LWL]MBZ5733458.1 Na-translocating system protein MpsB [Nocardioides sp. TRM66260-LWL]